MTEEKKTARKRRELPPGVAGRLRGMGIEIEVPQALWDHAATFDDREPKEMLLALIEEAIDEAAASARQALALKKLERALEAQREAEAEAREAGVAIADMKVTTKPDPASAPAKGA